MLYSIVCNQSVPVTGSMVCDPCDGETPVDSVSVVPAGYEVNWSKSTEYKCSVESEAIKLK